MDKASSSALVLARALLQSSTPMPLRRTSRIIPPPSSSLFVSRSRLSPRCTAPAQSCLRLFSSTAAARSVDEPPPPRSDLAPAKAETAAKTETAAKPTGAHTLMEGLANMLPSSRNVDVAPPPAAAAAAAGSGAEAAAGESGLGRHLEAQDDFSRMRREVDRSTEEYHFTVYAHKHNTHITVSKPNRDVITSLSCGNLGFRKSQRGTYDAAYQLGAYVCDRLYQNGWHKNMQKLDVTLRGFGPGREAVSKILLGTEGRLLRDKITKVADGTRLKFGGTRSKAPRRLG